MPRNSEVLSAPKEGFSEKEVDLTEDDSGRYSLLVDD